MTPISSITVIWGYRVHDNGGKWYVKWYCSDGATWHWTSNRADATPVSVPCAIEMMRGVEFITDKNLFVLEFVP